MKNLPGLVVSVVLALAASAPVCSAQVADVFRDPRMDFGSIRTVAVVPFNSLARALTAAPSSSSQLSNVHSPGTLYRGHCIGMHFT